MRSILHALLAPPDASLCCQVLHDVTRDSAAGLEATDAGAGSGVPSAADPAAMLPHLLELQRQTALMVNELLRHFWGCFPVSSKPRLDKLRRLHKGLSEQYDKCAHLLPGPAVTDNLSRSLLGLVTCTGCIEGCAWPLSCP